MSNTPDFEHRSLYVGQHAGIRDQMANLLGVPHESFIIQDVIIGKSEPDGSVCEGQVEVEVYYSWVEEL